MFALGNEPVPTVNGHSFFLSTCNSFNSTSFGHGIGVCVPVGPGTSMFGCFAYVCRSASNLPNDCFCVAARRLREWPLRTFSIEVRR